MARAIVKKAFPGVIKKKDVVEFAPHIMTLGAYVQQPDPRIVGLEDDEAIGSQDAKSLYPTIMVLMNIGYDTLRGRIYDMAIVGNLLQGIRSLHDLPVNDIKQKKAGVIDLGEKLAAAAKLYADSDGLSSKIPKAAFIEFFGVYYKNCVRQLVEYSGQFDNILRPFNNETYYLLKSCLYPLLEAFTWIHKSNKGYSNVAVDWVFYNDQFREKYNGKKFFVIHNINSVTSTGYILELDDMISHILTKYIINPYGTYFDRHKDNKSFEVDLILQGMDDRGFVKNQMLIVDAITENWQKIPVELQYAFLKNLENMNESEATGIVNIVGDSSEKIKNFQKKSLMSIQFNYKEFDAIMDGLLLMSQQKNSKSNGIKVTLNSGYGLFGMSTWTFGSSLISNSITNGGKVYGTKLFQQIAVNRLEIENQKINSGFYK